MDKVIKNTVEAATLRSEIALRQKRYDQQRELAKAILANPSMSVLEGDAFKNAMQKLDDSLQKQKEYLDGMKSIAEGWEKDLRGDS